jgi:hypothetical protein
MNRERGRAKLLRVVIHSTQPVPNLPIMRQYFEIGTYSDIKTDKN